MTLHDVRPARRSWPGGPTMCRSSRRSSSETSATVKQRTFLAVHGGLLLKQRNVSFLKVTCDAFSSLKVTCAAVHGGLILTKMHGLLIGWGFEIWFSNYHSGYLVELVPYRTMDFRTGIFSWKRYDVAWYFQGRTRSVEKSTQLCISKITIQGDSLPCSCTI